MGDILDLLGDQLIGKFSEATAELYKQAEGKTTISCGKCHEPVLVADSRPKMISTLEDFLRDSEAGDSQIKIALCCPKCCKEL